MLCGTPMTMVHFSNLANNGIDLVGHHPILFLNKWISQMWVEYHLRNMSNVMK